ncbi:MULTISPECIES: ESX secretion-associated protein EspG [Saccharopolyspora]|uniref:ESX secretion-associated protein EspG n=1 Tax=Saccharopolyspora cebuensis TaxID=418759 RepID=A0ABV4CSD2_9PSEU
MSVSGRWRLTPVQLDVVLKYLGIDGLTLPLGARSYGRTGEEFAAIVRAEQPGLVAAGIVVADEIEPRLAQALRVLARPYLWVDSLWFPQVGEDHCWRALAVQTEGDRVVLGVQPPGESSRYGGMLTVEVHEGVPLPQVLLPTLPPAPPGNRGAVQVPASSFRVDHPDDADEWDVMERPKRTTSGDREFARYQEIGKAPHVRLGQIAANLRDPNGRTTRSAVLRWFDNAEPDGRYLDYAEPGASGERLYLISPADARSVGARVRALIDQVR